MEELIILLVKSLLEVTCLIDNESVGNTKPNLEKIDRIEKIILKGIKLKYWTLHKDKEYFWSKIIVIEGESKQEEYIKEKFNIIRKSVTNINNSKKVEKQILLNIIENNLRYNKDIKKVLKSAIKKLKR